MPRHEYRFGRSQGAIVVMKNLEKEILMLSVMLASAILAGPVVREAVLMLAATSVALAVTERSFSSNSIGVRSETVNQGNQP
jgi:hypothetical protein